MATTTALASSNAGTLDVPSLVSQLMAAERRPIDKLTAQVTSYKTKISTLGTLKSLAASLHSSSLSLSSSFSNYAASTSDASVASATASSTALPGTYAITVTDLAQAHRLVAAGQASDTAQLTTVDSTVTIDVGGVATDVSVLANASLQDIATAINDAGLGVTASIVNDGLASPYRLVISADETGLANAVASITVKSGGDAALNDLLAYNPTENAPTPAIPMQETVPAADADFTVNGIRIVKSSNTISDAVAGLTFTLSKKSASATITVARDLSGVTDAVSDFVDAYNSLSSQIKTRSAYASDTATGGELAGDQTLRQMLQDMRSVILTPASGGGLTMLSEIGVTFQSDGSLKLDSTKLDTALKTGYSDVVNLFTSATGFATRMTTWTDTVSQTGGTLDTKVTSFNTSVSSLNSEIDRLEVKMVALEKKYTLTYATLNQLLDSMNKTGLYLTQQFSSNNS